MLDAQGRAIGNALSDLGYEAVTGVRVGKLVELEVAESDPAKAQSLVREACEKLLAEPRDRDLLDRDLGRISPARRVTMRGKGSPMRSAVAWIGAVCLLGALAPGAASAQSLEVSSDTAITLKGTTLSPRVPGLDDGVSLTIRPLGPAAPGITLPAGVNLDGFDRLANGDVLFSIDVATPIPGLAPPGIAHPNDVVQVGAAGPVLVFSGAVAGLPRGTNVDAVGREANGFLLLSFDSTVTIGGVLVADEDVVRVDPATYAATVVYDGSAQGVAAGLDLDGVYRDLDTGHLLLSFDGAGTLGGVSFSARDVLDWDPSSGVYTLAYDGAAAGWPAGANLDEVSGLSDGDGVSGPSDNCPFVANADQSDVGGVGLSGPDGIGDVCQCGEVDGDGWVRASDLAAIRAGLAGATGGVTAPERCSVVGAASAALVDTGMRADCDVVDVAVLTRALASLAPGVAQVCQVAAP